MEFGTVRGIVVVSGVSKRVYMPSAGTGRRLFCAESKVSEGMSVLEKSEEKERQAKRVLIPRSERGEVIHVSDHV